MFRKWPKTKRILVSQIDVKGKSYLSDKEVKALLAGKVSLTEKVDGANAGIIRHRDYYKLQKRGSLVEKSEHHQFQFFHNFAAVNYDKIMKIPKDTILYGELMRCQHTIYYDSLPDWFIAFAWYDRKSDTYFHRDEMVKLCENIGISYAPEISRGYFNKDELFDLIPKISNFGSEPAEGIVVWNHKRQMRGKLVREEFVKNMNNDIHWSKKSLRKNKLKDSK